MSAAEASGDAPRGGVPARNGLHDVIVLGVGGVGSAALYHLARRGCRVLGIDRFAPAHEQGSSHGETRIIRLAYLEHPDYVPLLHRAYAGWEDLERRTGHRLYHETGLLEAGPAGGEVVPGVLRSAREHALEVEELTAGEIHRRFPGFRVPEKTIGVLERRAGYLLVEDCVRTHIEEARRLGVELEIGDGVVDWSADDRGVTVRTGRGRHRAARLVIAAGAWSAALLGDLGVPLRVLRKPLLWYRTTATLYLEETGTPGFLFETPAGVFYGFPERNPGEIKLAEHTGGEVVPGDPLDLDRSLREGDRKPLERFLGSWLPGVSRDCIRHTVCMYTMTPDGHFVVDRHPASERVVFAAGLSGHGFKFTGVLGEALADLALEGGTDLPVGFLARARPRLPRDGTRPQVPPVDTPEAKRPSLGGPARRGIRGDRSTGS